MSQDNEEIVKEQTKKTKENDKQIKPSEACVWTFVR
jgi:hypothetical protein